MQNFKNLIEKRTSLAVIGLGYVGMPLAIAFADHINVTGFDLNKEKISLYKSGIDPTNEVGNEKIQKTTINFTTDEQQLQYASFHIIAVPTPINQDKTPDFGPIIGASTIFRPQSCAWFYHRLRINCLSGGYRRYLYSNLGKRVWFNVRY